MEAEQEFEPDTEDGATNTYQTTKANLRSLSLDSLVQGETDIVNNYRGKRKMPVSSAQSKITKTANVSFDYNSVNSRQPMALTDGKSYRQQKGGRNSAGTGNSRNRNSGVQTKNRQKITSSSASGSGPFREGYVDPYISESGRETFRRVHYQTDQPIRTTYRRPDFPRPSYDSTRGMRADGYVGDLCRDPRTSHTSGFGIYRNMKPRTRR